MKDVIVLSFSLFPCYRLSFIVAVVVNDLSTFPFFLNTLLTFIETLYRSDFFPGLGWMLTKDLWNELQPKWPKAFWDDWIRQPAQRKDRACIRPEISRTKTFGKIGVSKWVDVVVFEKWTHLFFVSFSFSGLFYEKHLKFIKLNQQFVPFSQKNLTYLLRVCSGLKLPNIVSDWITIVIFHFQENYDVHYLKIVYSSPVLTVPELVQGKLKEESSVRVTYRSKDQYKKTAKTLGLMDDFKVCATWILVDQDLLIIDCFLFQSGVPRTGYRGIVSCIYRKRRVFLAPPPDWKGYDTSWTW